MADDSERIYSYDEIFAVLEADLTDLDVVFLKITDARKGRRVVKSPRTESKVAKLESFDPEATSNGHGWIMWKYRVRITISINSDKDDSTGQTEKNIAEQITQDIATRYSYGTGKNNVSGRITNLLWTESTLKPMDRRRGTLQSLKAMVDVDFFIPKC